jgi:signal transduction histidine kinase
VTPAPAPLRVLMLEDSVIDATLVEFELRRGLGECTVFCVDGHDEFLGAIEAFVPQLILSDHRMGAFSGMHALQIAKRHAPDTPFLFVTGAIDEESATRYMAAGASDYILKDHLGRLVPAVKASLELQQAREGRRHAQEQLIHSQRINTLGRLASGIAHDYNNLTTAIIGYASLVMQTLPPGDPRLQDLEQVVNAGEQASDLSNQLLAFSRNEVVKFRRVSVNDVVTNTERMLRRIISERGISITTNLATVLPPVLCNAAQLQQVLINLAINARDAMPDGGTIAIETRAEPSHVRLSVIDTGTGMDDATQARMFEEFFTTKAPGQGTGLGLATVSAIVNASNGYIDVKSAPGEGTTMHILFPAAMGDDLTDAPAAEEFDSLSGTETILIAEDDDVVRALARRVLQNYGYTTIDAATGPDALRAAQTSMEIDLLLTDVVLPAPGGVPLFDAVQRHHPDVRAVFMSGHTDEAAGIKAVLERGLAFLPKPFHAKTLAKAVRLELNRLRN